MKRDRRPAMQKWNPYKHKNEPYIPPPGGTYTIFSDDMDEIINCPLCGKELLFGQGYTSKTIMTPIGFGYIVCEDCYKQEWKEERAAMLQEAGDRG
jgi:hypothetical protein